MVAWHGVPGKASQRIRPVGNGVTALLISEVVFIEVEIKRIRLAGSDPDTGSAPRNATDGEL